MIFNKTETRWAAEYPERRMLTSPRQATDRPFTVFICTACATERDLSTVEKLRPAIRRCPRAMLISTECMLGPLSCAARPAGYGVMALLQPCANDRVACGPPQWIGPITEDTDAAALREWLERGECEKAPLPRQLRRHDFWTRSASRSN